MGKLSRTTGLLHCKMEAKDYELEACGQLSLFSENHKDFSTMDQRALGRRLLTQYCMEYSWPLLLFSH